LAVWDSTVPLTILAVDGGTDSVEIIIYDSFYNAETDQYLQLTSARFLIAVTIIGGASGESAGGSGGLSPLVKYAIWAAVIIAVLLCIGFCVHRYVRARRARKDPMQAYATAGVVSP